MNAKQSTPAYVLATEPLFSLSSHLRKAGRTSVFRRRFSSTPVTQKKDVTNIGSSTNVSMARWATAGKTPPPVVGMRRSITPYSACSAGPVMTALSIATASSLRVS